MYKNPVNKDTTTKTNATISWDNMKFVVYLAGSWRWHNIDETYLEKNIQDIDFSKTQNLTIDAESITEFDTIGAYFLNNIIDLLVNKGLNPTLLISYDNQKLFNRVSQSITKSNSKSDHIPIANLQNTYTELSIIQILQKKLFKSYFHSLTFLGQTCVSLIQILKRPLSFDWNEVVRTINSTGINGIFVIVLLNFLIATTLTYEMAPQFTKYGANIYIVNFLGIAMLKEVSPLLTAIIIAGRTGSSITAEIGTMKVQEELDAIRTMGISPFQKLVIPKILGVVITTPLLTVIADIVGMMGGAIVSKGHLSLGYQLFFERLQDYVSINNYTVGLVKSVAFGLGIAFIGCMCGFKVRGDANSIGEQTTRSVVLSIVVIILLDAIFAVLFMNLQI